MLKNRKKCFIMNKQKNRQKYLASFLFSILLGGMLISGIMTIIGADNFTVSVNSDNYNVINTPISSATTKKWTFMVYIDADNNLESSGIEDLNEMETIGSSKDVNIVVQLDRIGGYDTSNGDWRNTKRYYVRKDSSQSTLGTAVSSLSEQNMGSASTLTNFIDWSQSNYPADNYALILWDHGSGIMWGSGEGGICYDDTSHDDYLTESEVKTAITGKNIDILGMDACLMASTEFWYGLSDEASYFVGSEATEPGDGWPFNTILSWLTSNPNATPYQLSEKITQKYLDSYTPESYYGAVTQSSVDASKMSALVTALNSFANDLSTNIVSNKAALTIVRSNVREFDDEPFIDLYDFATRVGSSIPSVSTKANALKTAITNAVIEEAHSPSLSGSHGLTIYFPETSSGFSNNYKSNSFSVDSTWDEFLLSYYSNNPSTTLDQFEDNDDEASAAIIQPGYYPTLLWDDEDYYNFTAYVDLPIHISIVFTHSTNDDLDITLNGADGNQIDISESVTDNEEISWTPSSTQLVSLFVDNSGTGTSVSYSLSIYIEIDDDSYDDGSGNDDFETATNINGEINSKITDLVAIDDDYYFFNASDDALVIVELEFTAAYGMLTLEVWWEDLEYYNLVASVGDADDDATYKIGTSDDIWTGFYVVVLNYENNTNYNLTVTVDYNADDVYDSSGEDNDYMTDPTVISTEGWIDDLVCIDDDYYNVTMEEGDFLYVEMSFSNDEGDIDLFVLDEDENMLAYSGYWSDMEYIVFYCDQAGDYSLLVYPYEINLNYSLYFNWSRTFNRDIYDGTNNFYDQIDEFPTLTVDEPILDLTAWQDDFFIIDTKRGDTYTVNVTYENYDSTLMLVLYDEGLEEIGYNYTDGTTEVYEFKANYTGQYIMMVWVIQPVESYDILLTTVEGGPNWLLIFFIILIVVIVGIAIYLFMFS